MWISVVRLVAGNLKPVLIGIVVLAVITGVGKTVSYIKEQSAQINSLQEAYAAEVRNVEALATSQRALTKALTTVKQQSERAAERTESLNQEFAAVQKVVADQRRVIETHDLERLTKAKPGLIQRLANKATAARFAELEAVINDQNEATGQGLPELPVLSLRGGSDPGRDSLHWLRIAPA